MPIAVPAFIDVVAQNLQLDPAHVARYWRTLREMGRVNRGTRGIGGQPAAVTAPQAVQLLTALLVSDSARSLPDLMPAPEAWVSPGALSRQNLRIVRPEGDELVTTIGTVEVVQEGATFFQAFEVLLDLMRCSDPQVAMEGRQFGPVTIASSGGEQWAEIAARIMISSDHQPSAWKGADPAVPAALQPYRILWDASTGQATGMVYGKPPGTGEVPKWARPAPLVRLSSVNVPALVTIANALGKVAPDQLSTTPSYYSHESRTPAIRYGDALEEQL